MSAEKDQQVFWLKFMFVRDAVLVRTAYNASCAHNSWEGGAHLSHSDKQITDMSEYENVVFVGQLTSETQPEVAHAFPGAIAVQVKDGNADKSKFAFVHFQTAEEAHAAVQHANGKMWPNSGREIKCSLRK
jgi:hypothetical protein